MASERNPFPQDIEQLGSPARRSCFERFIIPCASALGGMIVGGLVVFFFMSMMTPYGVGTSYRFPENAANTFRRSILTNGSTIAPTDIQNISETQWMATLPTDQMATSVNLTSAAVHSVPFTYEPIRTANRTTTGLPTSNLAKTNRTSFGVMSVPYTRDSEIGRTEFPQVVLKYPEIPTAEMCTGKRMSQSEFLNKQWFCYRCGLAFDAKNMTTRVDATTAEEYRYGCHINCGDNEVFQACAHHLYLVQEPSSVEARQCTYCKEKPHTD